MYAPQHFSLTFPYERERERGIAETIAKTRETCSYVKGKPSRVIFTRDADQSRKPKRNFVLTAYIYLHNILYIYIFIYSYIIYIYFFFALFFPLCISFTFSMKIISSAARFVALVRHLPGDGAPETGNRARTGYLRPGYRPINTRTGSPVPATWESPSDGR